MAKHAKPMSLSLRVTLVAVASLLAAATAVTLVWLSLRDPHPTMAPSVWSVSETDAVSTIETSDTTTTESTTTGTTTTKYIFKSLTFSSPTATKFTTTESSIAFLGSTDPKATLTMNGKAVALSDIGGFSLDVPLQPGVNTFRFVSGGKTVTYQVTYKVEVLRSVSPSSAVTLDGGGSIQFRAVARRGATVTATFGGQTRSMTLSGQPEDAASDFTTYQATFQLPSGTVGATKSLGRASITATYNGLSKTMQTATVTLKAKSSSQFVTVTRDYAETFSGSVVNDYSRPTSAYLPAGTVDQVIKSGSAAGNTYYLLGCGRWVYTDDVAAAEGVKKLTDTPLTGGAVTVSQPSTDLTLAADWKIPYNLQLLPQTYAAPNADIPDYAITGQTTEYIDITFYYVSQVPAAPDVSASPLFSKATWRQSGEQWVLRLTLRQKGVFVGYSVWWEQNTLHFSFKHPSSTAGNPATRPLQGIRIVVDPGHGGSSSGTYGTIKGLYEKKVALEYSLLLRDKLKSLGAEVIMTRTTDVLPDNPTMSTRTAHARNNHTDLLLSIHMNGSTSASASGCTLHYFNEYSYDMARRLTDTMRAVEKQHGIGNRSQVTIWSPFFMSRLHDCPSVLVECGFMTNAANMNKLVDVNYRAQMINAIAKAVVEYFAAQPVLKVTQTTTTTTTTATTTTTTTATSTESTTDPTTPTTEASTTTSTTVTTPPSDEEDPTENGPEEQKQIT